MRARREGGIELVTKYRPDTSPVTGTMVLLQIRETKEQPLDRK